MDFKSFGLHPRINDGLLKMNYAEPTPIQAKAIPMVLNGKDVLGIAQTGTGKTAAFALPILQRLMTGPRRKLRALIVAPTRELAEQIHENFQELGRDTRFRSATIYGGVAMSPQIRKLREGAEVVIACPGRLLDHMNRGTINLSAVEVLVLDEADRMFDMGFMPEVRKIVKALPENRQSLLFSATMPGEIRHLADEVLKNPETVKVDSEVLAKTVTHVHYPVQQDDKTTALLSILKGTDTESVLVFTRTKHRAARIAEKLEREGYRATSLQGNLSQNRRQEALKGFKSGTYQVMVATDIAARGIDVATISHVINFDMPNTVEDYVHRTGRTGRACRSGDAFSLVTREDSSLVRAIQKELHGRVEHRAIEGLPKVEIFGGGITSPSSQRPSNQRKSQPAKPWQKAGNWKKNNSQRPAKHNRDALGQVA